MEEYFDQDQQRLKRRYILVDNLLDGDYEEYDESGSLIIQAYYRQGQLEGEFKFYDRQKLLFAGEYKYGKQDGISRTYDTELGVMMSEMQYREGKLDGPSLYFDGQGHLLRSCYYLEGELHGDCVQYYPHGQLQMECRYLNGKLEGEKRLYHQNGVLQAREVYKNGQLQGESEHYDQQGQREQGGSSSSESSDVGSETKLDFFRVLGVVLKSFFSRKI